MTAIKNTTPLMQQYFAIKKQHKNNLLLFQVGDFYELFYEDAQKASSFLGITLTTRGKQNDQPIPLCGVPVHTINFYLPKLIKGGFTVALCDQLEEAKPGMVVKRGVTRVLTPATLIDDPLLDAKNASYLLAWFCGKEQWSLIFCELLSAQIYATTLPANSLKELEAELVRFRPDEIIASGYDAVFSYGTLLETLRITYHYQAYNELPTKEASSWVATLTHNNPKEYSANINCALATLHWYLDKTAHTKALTQLHHIHYYKSHDYLVLDAPTQRSLHILRNNELTSENTLFSVLDHAATTMGSRMIKKWLAKPLVNTQEINERLRIVELLTQSSFFRKTITTLLQQSGDIERIVGRIALQRTSHKDLRSLTKALIIYQDLKKLLVEYLSIPLFKELCTLIEQTHELANFLTRSINQNEECTEIIRRGFNDQLDATRHLIENSTQQLVALEHEQQQATGINSLKIRYNSLQGYYAEITKTNLHLVPSYYVRCQSLVGKERFTFEALKKLELEILHAQETIQKLECDMLNNIINHMLRFINPLRSLSDCLAQLDALLSFAYAACTYGYTKPITSTKNQIVIKEGRHPVLAKKLGHSFVHNDVFMNDHEKMLLITGPNMGGKSTFLRQLATMAIMHQCGSFVPATHAELPLFDRIFTRIGAGDDLAAGKSTFLVEMEETATICTATHKSLVILDEVGRGTSTYDGLAIAQALVEYLHTTIKPFCLFATHYHELTSLCNTHPGIVAYHATSAQTEQGLVLLYKIARGNADGSFGLEVARLAQLPESLLKRAHELFHQFTTTKYNIPSSGNTELTQKKHATTKKLEDQCAQFSFIKHIDFNELSPKKAFDMLWELRERINDQT